MYVCGGVRIIVEVCVCMWKCAYVCGGVFMYVKGYISMMRCMHVCEVVFLCEEFLYEEVYACM